MIAAWPTGYDVERYAEEHGLDFEDITRDIVRLQTASGKKYRGGRAVLRPSGWDTAAEGL